MMESEGGYTLDDVLNCPFCGGTAFLKGAAGWGYHVSCKSDGCYANTSSAKHADFQAVEAWNRRTTHPQPVTPDRIQQLKTTIARLEEMNDKHAERMQSLEPVTPAGGEVVTWHAFPDELSSSDTVTMYRAPCESMCLLTGRTQSTVPVITHPPVADAALAELLPGTYYMDPPDGGSVTVMEQLYRMAKDAERYRWWRENIDLLDQQSMLGIAYSCQIPIHNGFVADEDLMDLIADSQEWSE